ncbi:FtsX-like permease family protein [Spongiivirga sp. MCCC 1A20706]|uniref:ABC transporter permease n=1 Tax=Spongiivirga sp. MCCC 1A20706 TaxID=3160963 RepID=UPI0039774319
MIKNYLKIAWRGLRKKPLYATINILGLFAGIAFVLLIGAYVWQEYNVNRNLKNAENQYILTSQWKDANMGVEFATLAPPAAMLKESYPHLVKGFYRWDGIRSVIVNGDKKFREGIQIGDASFLDQFGFKLLYGDQKSVFEKPYSVLITEEKAIKYFGTTQVVGNTLSIENFSGNLQQFEVTGVLKDLDENSITWINNQYNGIFTATNSREFFDRADFENWEIPFFISFIELQPGITAKELEQPLQEILSNHASENIINNLTLVPIPLTDYYLQKNSGLIKKMLYTLSFIGLFIIAMAIINFVNIAVSFSSSRMREIGIRKVLGGKRKQLVFQFLSESTILVSIATILAVIAYPFLGNVFEQVIGKSLITISSYPPYAILIPFLIILLVGFMSGIYPAFILSALKPVQSLKGKLQVSNSTILIRKLFVGFQFTMALVVIIAAFLITKQINFFFDKDLGYEKEYLISAATPRDWSEEGIKKMITNRNELEALPQVSKVSLSYEIPNGNNGFQLPLYKKGMNPESNIAVQGMVVDENYLDTYQIPLLQGSVFEANADGNTVLINAQAVKLLGFETKEMAIGKQLQVAGQERLLTIKGVIENIHFESLHTPIKPQAYFDVNALQSYRYLTIKLRPGNVQAGIEAIKEKWQELMPNAPFEFDFIDDTLATLYTNETQLQKASYSASVLAFIIVLLGIFGLVSLSIQKRIKEIGVRKVLGASKHHISRLFIKDFAGVLLGAILVAIPSAYFIINVWLQNYVYKISIGFSAFLLGILIIAGTALLLILLQTAQAANKNVINNLKTE